MVIEDKGGHKIDRRVHTIKTFYVPQDKFQLLDKFEDIAYRERKDFSPMVMTAIEEYIKKHGDGNPNFQLTQWAEQENFRAEPAFSRISKDWMEYVRSQPLKEIEYISNQAGMIQNIARRYIDLQKRGVDIANYLLQL